jgi:hypothetical protein
MAEQRKRGRYQSHDGGDSDHETIIDLFRHLAARGSHRRLRPSVDHLVEASVGGRGTSVGKDRAAAIRRADSDSSPPQRRESVPRLWRRSSSESSHVDAKWTVVRHTCYVLRLRVTIEMAKTD